MSIKVTKQLTEWLREQGLSADASEDEAKTAAATALADGSLEIDEFKRLTSDPDAENASKLEKTLDRVLQRLGVLEEAGNGSGNGSGNGQQSGQKDGQKDGQGNATQSKTPKERSYFDRFMSQSTPAEMEISDEPIVRQVGAEERYDKARTAAHYPMMVEKGNAMVRHPLGGRRVYEAGEAGRYLNEPSELDTAVAGAYFRWCLHVESKGGIGLPQKLKMTQHDRDLVQYALHKEKWAGVIHGEGSEEEGAIAVKNRTLTPSEIKAVLDDSTSGGLEVAPIVFDDQIILTPLLHGEFFPRVNVVNLTRGRRVEGASMANVTINSAGADGTAIDLENTASFITAFDTTIFVADGAIELGLDFMSDSPVDNAALVVQSYGEQLLAWLDQQICIGDGTTEPEGITNASGTTTVNADNGATGPPTVGDYESLLFGVTKAFKRGAQNGQIAFGANETTYQRARGIAVGSSDARRVFGMTHEDYMMFGRPYGINASFTNRQIVFGHFGRYRMYRRLGLTIKSTTEGKELVRNNLLLISARSRWGGQVETGSAFAVQTDGQS